MTAPEQPLLVRANAAFAAGDMARAETLYLQGLALTPGDPGLLHNLAVVALRLNDQKKAEQWLRQTVQGRPMVESVYLLGEICKSDGRNEEAAAYYAHILKAKPNHFGATLALGDIKDQGGDKSGARECYRIAAKANPADITASTKYSSAMWDVDPEVAVKITEKLLARVGPDPRARIKVLETLMYQKEWSERIRRGLAPYHASRIDELLFNFGTPYVEAYEAANKEILAGTPNDPQARMGFAVARFCLKDRHTAGEILASLRDNFSGHVFETVNFSPTFYDKLRQATVDDLTRDLPPLINLTDLPSDSAGVLYLSCNFLYFLAFALPMICSLQHKSPHTPVHLHIMDASESEAKFAIDFCTLLKLPRFAVSIERPGLQQASQMEARCYYHAVRFIRFHQHLQAYRCPLWLMDVDAIINRDLSELFAMLGDNDAAMRVRPGRTEPWNQFNASCVGSRATPRALEYFRLIAAYVSAYHQEKRLRWGIDQLAMYGVFADMADHGEAPALTLLGEREVDYTYQDDGFVWGFSGVRKFQHLRRLANPNAAGQTPLESNKFVVEFERWFQKAQDIALKLGWKI